MRRKVSEDMLAIWRAGVAGVDPARLIDETVNWDTDSQTTTQSLKTAQSQSTMQRQMETKTFWIEDTPVFLDSDGRVLVIGAGKASGKMALALEQKLLPVLGPNRFSGWVNVPEDCVIPTQIVHLHGARPGGVNEPTREGVHGSREIIRRLTALRPQDVCLCVISGGGSALLPAPVPEISLQEKVELTRFLSGVGANINELNTIRKQLSLLKGGGLKRLSPTRKLYSLILSDVLGDPLDVIASGPTVENSSTASDALEVLYKYLGGREDRFGNIQQYLFKKVAQQKSNPSTFLESSQLEWGPNPVPHLADWGVNLVLGNNAVAVDSAGSEAEKRGYSHAMISARTCEGDAEQLGKHLADQLFSMFVSGPNCLISGGEPTVHLVDESIRGKGGRNQQLVLAALIEILRRMEQEGLTKLPFSLGFLSGGTDGEDGPSDAAGAFIDEKVLQRILEQRIDPTPYLQRNDAYTFFDSVGGLLKTGPTGTNVCDLRVLVVDRF